MNKSALVLPEKVTATAVLVLEKILCSGCCLPVLSTWSFHSVLIALNAIFQGEIKMLFSP